MYDKQYELFLQGTQFEMNCKSDLPDLQFREVVVGEEKRHVIVPLYQQIAKEFASQLRIGQGQELNKEECLADQLEKFKKSSPPYLVEFSKKTGKFFVAFQSMIFVFEKDNLYALLTGKNQKSLKEVVASYHVFENTICQLIVYEDEIIVEAGMEIRIFKQSDLTKCMNQIPASAFKDAQFIRQISHNQKTYAKGLKILITTNTQTLFEYMDGKLVECKAFKVRSAIYNQATTDILAFPAPDGDNPAKKHHMQVLQSGSDLKQAQNQIFFDFSKECKRNYFRTYYATMYENGTTFICGAFFTSDDDIDDLVGTIIIFAINRDIDKKTTWNDIYGSKTGDFKYFYQTDLHHNNDEDGEGSQPIIKAAWLDSVKCSSPDQMLACAVQVNHETQPFFFLKDSKNNFIFTDYEKFNPLIRRPMDDGGNEIDDVECLGSTLGVCFIDVLLSEEQTKIQRQLYEEEDDKWNCPPFYIMFGLDGQLYVWEAYQNRLQKAPLPPVSASSSAPSQPLMQSMLNPPTITMKKTTQPSKTTQSISSMPTHQSLSTPQLSNFPSKQIEQVDKNDEREEYGDEVAADPADKILIEPKQPKREAADESQQIEEVGDIIRLDKKKVEEEKVREEPDEVVDPVKQKEIIDKLDKMRKIMDENQRKEHAAKMESLELMLGHLDMQMSEYNALPRALQELIDNELKDFKRRAKFLDVHEEEVIELIREPQIQYSEQKLADESNWRQQFQDSLCSTQPQDKDEQLSQDEIQVQPSPNTFQLYVLKIEDALTHQYNQTVVRQMRSMINNFHADMKNFPKINPKEIDMKDQDLPVQVIEEMQKIRNLKNAVQNIGQAQEMMKRQLDKGLPSQESFEIMNRSVNMCKSEFEYFQLLITRLKEYRVTGSSGNLRKLFTDAEVDYLQAIIHKAKDFEDKLTKIKKQIDLLSQIPIVISQQLQNNQKHMTQSEILEMIKVVEKHAEAVNKAKKQAEENQQRGQLEVDGGTLLQPTENHHVIKQIASDFSNFNMRIQGSFISELFNSLQKHLQTLDNFLKQTGDMPASPPLKPQASPPRNSPSKPQGQKVVSWGAIQEDLELVQGRENVNEAVLPSQSMPIAKKSTAQQLQNKRKAIREKLRGGSYRTSTKTIEMEAGIDIEQMILGEHQRVKTEVDQFKQVLKQCSYEQFVGDRDKFESDLRAQINLQNLQIPQLIAPDQIPQGVQIAPQPRPLSPPRNLENSLLNISLDQQHQKAEQLKQMILDTEQKKLKELQKIRERIEQEEKLIQDKIKQSKVLQQFSDAKNQGIPKKQAPAGGQVPKALPGAPKEKKEEEKKEEEAAPGVKHGVNKIDDPVADSITPFQKVQSVKKEPEKQKKEADPKPMNPLAKMVLQKGQEAKEKAEKDDEAKIKQALTNFQNSKSGAKEPGKDMSKFEDKLESDLLCNSNEAAGSSYQTDSAHNSPQSLGNNPPSLTQNKDQGVFPIQTAVKQQPLASKPQGQTSSATFAKPVQQPQNEKNEDNAANAAPVANKFDSAKSPFSGGFTGGIKGFGNPQQDQKAFGQVSMNQIATNQMGSGQPLAQSAAKGAIFGNHVFGQANAGSGVQANAQATFTQFTANAQSQQQNTFFSAARQAQLQQPTQNPSFASISGQNPQQQPPRNPFTGGGFQFVPSANMVNPGGANLASSFADDGNDPFARSSGPAQTSSAPNQGMFSGGGQGAPPGNSFGFGLASGQVQGAGQGGGFMSQLNFTGGGSSNLSGAQFSKARK